MVISEVAVLGPFVVVGVDQSLHSHKLGSLKPVFLENTTAVSRITAEAALLPLRIDNIPLVVNCELGAGSGHIGQNPTAE